MPSSHHTTTGIIPDLSPTTPPMGTRRSSRSSIPHPDLGIGRLRPDGIFHLQGGVEQKWMIPEMSQFPAPSDAELELIARYAFQTGCRQAFDQVKTAIKNGNLPNDRRIQWVIAVGPYFIIKECGPLTQADLETRGHRSNPSGDAAVTAFLADLHANPTSVAMLY